MDRAEYDLPIGDARPMMALTLPDLAQVLAEVRSEASVLRRTGNSGQADYLLDICERVDRAAKGFMQKLTFEEALARSGWTERTLRRRFRDFQQCDLAGYTPAGNMWFLARVIPYQTPGSTETAARALGRDPFKIGAQ